MTNVSQGNNILLNNEILIDRALITSKVTSMMSIRMMIKQLKPWSSIIDFVRQGN